MVKLNRSSRTKFKLFQFLSLKKDRDQTASRRSEPSSCNILIDEQSNPWELLHHQDMLNRHRGAKHFYRYELLKNISLLSPE